MTNPPNPQKRWKAPKHANMGIPLIAMPAFAETEQRFTLPWPVSVNRMFANVPGKGRVKSEAYKKWIVEAGWTLRSYRPKSFTVPVQIEIAVNPPTGRSFDLDNLQKGLLDLLVKHQVIPDDSRKWVRKISIECVDVGQPCVVAVRAA